MEDYTVQTQEAIRAARGAIAHLDGLIAHYEGERHRLRIAVTAMAGDDMEALAAAATPAPVLNGEHGSADMARERIEQQSQAAMAPPVEPPAATPAATPTGHVPGGRRESDVPYDMFKTMLMDMLRGSEEMRYQHEMRDEMNMESDWFRTASRRMESEGLITRTTDGNRTAIAMAVPPQNGDRQATIMAMVAADPGMTVPALSEKLGLTTPPVYGYVNRMAEEGMLTKTDDRPAALYLGPNADARFSRSGAETRDESHSMRSEPATA